MVELEHARALLEQMGLQTAAQLLDAQLEQSLHTQQTYVQFLNELLSSEQQERQRKSRETRLKLARLPRQPQLFNDDSGLDANAKALLKVLSFEPLSLEEILEKSGLDLASAGMGLLDLEMSGRVAQTAARSYYLL